MPHHHRLSLIQGMNYLKSITPVNALQEIILGFMNFHKEWVKTKETDASNISHVLVASPSVRLYIAASLHAILRTAYGQDKTMRGIDLCMLMMGIMTSVLDAFSPQGWSWANHLNPSGVWVMFSEIHKHYINLNSKKKLPMGFDVLANKTLPASLRWDRVSRWALTETHLQGLEEMISYMQFEGGVSNASAALPGKKVALSAADIMDLERASWEAVLGMNGSSSVSRPLVDYQFNDAVQRLVICMDSAKLLSILKALRGEVNDVGLLLSSLSWGAIQGAGLRGSGTGEFTMDDFEIKEGMLVLKNTINLPLKLISEMNGWRILLPTNLRGDLVFARLSEDRMVSWVHTSLPQCVYFLSCY